MTHTIEFTNRADAKEREELGPNTVDAFRRGASWFVVVADDGRTSAR